MASSEAIMNQIKAKEKEVLVYTNRLKGVEMIINQMVSVVSDNVRIFNADLYQVMENLEAGLKDDQNKTTSILGQLNLSMEKMTDDDVKLFECKSNLLSEKLRCERKIQELEREISSLKTAYAEAVAAEAAAEKEKYESNILGG